MGLGVALPTAWGQSTWPRPSQSNRRISRYGSEMGTWPEPVQSESPFFCECYQEGFHSVMWLKPREIWRWSHQSHLSMTTESMDGRCWALLRGLRIKPAQKTVSGINLKVSMRAQNPACLKPVLPLLFSYYAPVSLVFSSNQLEEKFGAICCGFCLFLFFPSRSHNRKYLDTIRSEHFLKTLPFFTWWIS